LITGQEGGNVIHLILITNETNAPSSTYVELIRNFDALSIQDIILKESNKNNQDSANIAAIIGGVGTAIAFWVRLEMKVKHLEKQIEENPIFVAFKQFERDAAIKIFDDYLKNKLEKKIG
jgi:hypothetical protein